MTSDTFCFFFFFLFFERQIYFSSKLFNLRPRMSHCARETEREKNGLRKSIKDFAAEIHQALRECQPDVRNFCNQILFFPLLPLPPSPEGTFNQTSRGTSQRAEEGGSLLIKLFCRSHRRAASARADWNPASKNNVVTIYSAGLPTIWTYRRKFDRVWFMSRCIIIISALYRTRRTRLPPIIYGLSFANLIHRVTVRPIGFSRRDFGASLGCSSSATILRIRRWSRVTRHARKIIITSLSIHDSN